MFRTLYSKICKPLQNQKHRAFVDVCIATVAGYFTLKKYFGWSFSTWLSTIFTDKAVLVIEWPLLALAGYVFIMKVVLLILDAFPATRVRVMEAEGLNHCCLRINHEISRHYESIVNSPQSAVATFTAQHNFDVNVALVVKSLADHAKATLNGARTRDIFISVYAVPKFEDPEAPRTSLSYLTHYDPRKDYIHSRSILFSDKAFEQYECVKCIVSTRETCVQLNCKEDYYRSPSKRHKTIHHYVGMKIHSNGILLGFVNIEFHNKRFFNTEDELISYIESDLIAFRYLLEYQFLKKLFFTTVARKLLS